MRASNTPTTTSHQLQQRESEQQIKQGNLCSRSVSLLSSCLKSGKNCLDTLAANQGMFIGVAIYAALVGLVIGIEYINRTHKK